MIVGKDKQIYFRKIFSFIQIGSCKRLSEEFKRGSKTAKNRVYQNVIAFKTQKIGRMPKPNYYRFFSINIE
jgi:hypothetical protein